LRDYVKSKYTALVERMEQNKDLTKEDEAALQDAIKDWKKSGSY